MRMLHLIPWLALLSSCSSPPKPPMVDESAKRPANSASGIELQVCKSELQNTRIAASESSRLAEAAHSKTVRLQAQQAALAAAASALPAGNSVFVLHFDFGSTHLVVPDGAAAPLLQAARDAPLVMLRGRTDGTSDSPAESRVARDRAQAVRDYLIAGGIDPLRIRATYQASGDYQTENTSAAGRSMNRRVEIEVYRTLPTLMSEAEMTSR